MYRLTAKALIMIWAFAIHVGHKGPFCLVYHDHYFFFFLWFMWYIRNRMYMITIEPQCTEFMGFCCSEIKLKLEEGMSSRWKEYLDKDFFLFCQENTLWVLPASVAQLDAPSDWRPGGRGFNPRRGRQHSFVEIDREIFSTVILSLPLIQEGQLSVSGKRMCTILVNRLED